MLIYKSRVFDLFSSSVNSRRAPFEYVGHPGSCSALILDQRDEVGLIAHHRLAIGHTLFELPTSILQRHQSVEETMTGALRLQIRLVLSASQLRHLTSLYSSPGHTSELVTLFFCRITSEQRKKTTELRWFNFGELNHLIHTREIIDMKTVAAITAYQAILWKGLGDEVL